MSPNTPSISPFIGSSISPFFTSLVADGKRIRLPKRVKQSISVRVRTHDPPPVVVQGDKEFMIIDKETGQVMETTQKQGMGVFHQAHPSGDRQIGSLTIGEKIIMDWDHVDGTCSWYAGTYVGFQPCGKTQIRSPCVLWVDGTKSFHATNALVRKLVPSYCI